MEKRGLKVWRSYVGEYCTSLEMNGMSVTLCKVDDELKKLLTAPAEIPIRVLSDAVRRARQVRLTSSESREGRPHTRG